MSNAEPPAPQPPSARSIDIDLAELQHLRVEIMTRAQIAMTLIVAELTAVGAGLSIVATFPDVLLGLAFVSPFLWILWLDYSSQIHKIAAYISLRLKPRLEAAGSDGLGWEDFYRRVDEGGATAAAALGLPAGKKVTLKRVAHISRYMMVLFALTPIILLAVYLVRFEWDTADTLGGIGRLVAAALVAIFIAVGFQKSRQYADLVATVSEAITADAGGRRGDLPPPSGPGADEI